MGKQFSQPLRLPMAPSGIQLNTYVASGPVNYDEMPPVFSLCHLDAEYGIECCQPNDLKEFLDKLRELGKLTWSQIKSAPRHGHGTELIPIIRLKRPKPSFLPADVERLIAFRFHGKASMLGYRERNVFHVCFLDPKFELYRHG